MVAGTVIVTGAQCTPCERDHHEVWSGEGEPLLPPCSEEPRTISLHISTHAVVSMWIKNTTAFTLVFNVVTMHL